MLSVASQGVGIQTKWTTFMQFLTNFVGFVHSVLLKQIRLCQAIFLSPFYMQTFELNVLLFVVVMLEIF